MPHLTGWDVLTFAAFAIIGLGFLATIVFFLGLPGRIAIARQHPDAEAIKMMGWLGFIAVIPWMQAFLWAFKPTDVVDIRRFPKEEQRDINIEIARLGGKPAPHSAPHSAAHFPAPAPAAPATPQNPSSKSA